MLAFKRSFINVTDSTFLQMTYRDNPVLKPKKKKKKKHRELKGNSYLFWKKMAINSQKV